MNMKKILVEIKFLSSLGFFHHLCFSMQYILLYSFSFPTNSRESFHLKMKNIVEVLKKFFSFTGEETLKWKLHLFTSSRGKFIKFPRIKIKSGNLFGFRKKRTQKGLNRYRETFSSSFIINWNGIHITYNTFCLIILEKKNSGIFLFNIYLLAFLRRGLWTEWIGVLVEPPSTASNQYIV